MSKAFTESCTPPWFFQTGSAHRIPERLMELGFCMIAVAVVAQPGNLRCGIS